MIPLDGKSKPRKLSLPQLKSVTTARLSPDGKLALVRGDFAEPGAKPDDETREPHHSYRHRGRQAAAEDSKPSKTPTSPVSPSRPTARNSRSACATARAEIWDTASAKKIRALPPAKEDADTRSIAFSPDGKAADRRRHVRRRRVRLEYRDRQDPAHLQDAERSRRLSLRDLGRDLARPQAGRRRSGPAPRVRRAISGPSAAASWCGTPIPENCAPRFATSAARSRR